MGLGRTTSGSIIHTNLHKPNNKLVSARLEHFWCTDEPHVNINSQDSPQFRLGGNHHLPPCNILYAWPWDQHPNVILSWDSQMGVLKFSKLGLPQLWKPITLCANLRLRLGLKQSCSPCWELSKGVWHVTCTQGNQGDSWLLMLDSQIGNLIFDPSFGHNLCLNDPNESCKRILNICVPRDFQWFKEIFNLMGFDPYNYFLKIRKSIWTPIPKMGVHLGVWKFIPSHSLTLPHFREHEMWLPSFTIGLYLRKPLLWPQVQC
jgi:hypothetical protein